MCSQQLGQKADDGNRQKIAVGGWVGGEVVEMGEDLAEEKKRAP